MAPSSNTWTAFFRSAAAASQIGFSIALPLVALALAGRYLDRRFATSPWFFLGGIFLSLLISTGIMYVQMTRILSLMDGSKENKKDYPDRKEQPPSA